MESLLIAKNIGYCLGVSKCISLVNSLLEFKNCKICVFGYIVHNTQTINVLKKCRVKFISKIEDVVSDELLILRAHGSTKQTYNYIEQRGYVKLRSVNEQRIEGKKYFIDTICPFVNKIHNIIKSINKSEGKKNAYVIIFGDAKHCEVKAIVSFCETENCVLADVNEAADFLKKHSEIRDKFIYVVFQTTFEIDEAKKCTEYIKNMYTKFTFFNTICNETKRRQKETKFIALNSDIVLVIGSSISANTLQLQKICKKYCKTVLLENIDTINAMDLNKCRRVGLVTGASTPKKLVEKVRNSLKISKISQP